MKIECILIVTFSLIAFADAHACLSDPIARSGLSVNQYSGGYQNMWYYRDGSPHICGNNGFDKIKNTQLTGKVTKTYTSGTKVTMKAYFHSAHQGFFRLKLCKLSSASEMVTEDCFNQELLKIKSEVPFFEFRNTTKPFYIDDYTLRVAASDPITGETLSLNVTLEVQLPVGLTCENCVLLFDYKHSALKHIDSNGNTFNMNDFYNPEYDGPIGMYQTFRSCYDIKIVSNPDQASSVYKPNPVKPKKIYPLRLFACETFSPIAHVEDIYNAPANESSNWKLSQYPNMRPDLNKFKGQGVFCLVDSDQRSDACSICQQNCQTPDKQCPSFCLCRWYPNDPLPYSIPVNKGEWQF